MATKTLRVTLADILGPAGPTGRVRGEVWALFVDGDGSPRQIRKTDGTVIVPAKPRQALDSEGVVDFVIVPNDDATIHADDQGFGVKVGWDLTVRGERGAREPVKSPGTVVSVTTADPAIVQFGLKAEYVPVIEGSTYLTEATATAAFATPGTVEQRVAEIRRGKLGKIGTSGKGVVALRFDHQLDPFIAKCQPLLVARALPWGIGVVTKSVGNPTAAYEPTTATWADVKNLILYKGGEVWAHSQTHSDGVALWGGTSLVDEIVGSKADIEAQGIRPMGWQQPGGPSTYAAAHLNITDMNDAAGRLIKATYGLYESYLDGTVFRPLPTDGSLGLNHQTIDTMTVANVKAAVDRAVDTKCGVEFMLHALNLDDGGSYMSTASFTEVLDYIVTKRDAGLIEVLTPSGLAFADPTSTWRQSLFTMGDFEGQTSATVPSSWAQDTSSWTINTDGGHSGATYLHVPTSQTLLGCRVAAGQMGADGFTFMFDGWCRSTDVGGATYRVTASTRGTTNTTLFNATGVLAQSTSWTRVRIPFTTAVLPLSDLLTMVGRVAGGSVDWDDIKVVAV